MVHIDDIFEIELEIIYKNTQKIMSASICEIAKGIDLNKKEEEEAEGPNSIDFFSVQVFRQMRLYTRILIHISVGRTE